MLGHLSIGLGSSRSRSQSASAPVGLGHEQCSAISASASAMNSAMQVFTLDLGPQQPPRPRTSAVPLAAVPSASNIRGLLGRGPLGLRPPRLLDLSPPRSPRPRSFAVPSALDLQVSPRRGPSVLGNRHVDHYLPATATYRISL